jgi:hypothetical protein
VEFFLLNYDDLIRKLDCQKEFEDFTDESRQLEQELETTLIQNEKQIRDLNGMVISLRGDNEALRVSFFTMLIKRRR